MDQFAVGCFGLLVTAAVGLSIVLPIVTAVRLNRALASIVGLRAQIREMETRLTAAAHMASAPSPAVAEPVTVPAPPAPEPAPAAPVPATAALVPAAPTEADRQPPPPIPLAPEAHWPARQDGPAEPAEPQPAVARTADNLESRLGGRGLLYAGVATLVFAIGFFVKYAFDNAWITETARVAVGAAMGVAMVAAGRRFIHRGYARYGEVLAGGGFAAMYISAWAALNVYGLIARPAAFVVMVVITAWAGLLADRLASQALAWVAVLGGFATPGLVAGRQDAQVVLLTYIAVLAAGAMLLAARRQWPVLGLASYVLTVLTFLSWAASRYTASKFVTTQVFLVVFGVLFGWAYWRRCERTDARDNPLPAIVLASVLMLFHGGSVANLIDHSVPLLVYLIAVTLAGTFVSVRMDRPWIRLVTLVAVAPVLLAWVGTHTSRAWLAPAAVVIVAQYAMLLAACGERVSRDSGAWPRAEVVLFYGNALALFAGLYVLADAHWPYWTAQLAVALAVWHGLVAWRLRAATRDGAVHSVALMFAMIGFAIGLQFADWWAVAGWAVEAGAVYWAGLRTGRRWLRLGGLVLAAVVTAGLLSMDYVETPAAFAVLWNPRAGATLAVVAALYAMSFFYRRANGADRARTAYEYGGLLLTANILTVLLLSVEINSYWHLRTADDATASFALLASLSIAWGLYGTALVLVGIMRRYAPIRYLAIGLLLLTVAKVFLVDFSELGGVYRIVGFMGLGVFLLLGAWLYQRFKDVIQG